MFLKTFKSKDFQGTKCYITVPGTGNDLKKKTHKAKSQALGEKAGVQVSELEEGWL